MALYNGDWNGYYTSTLAHGGNPYWSKQLFRGHIPYLTKELDMRTYYGCPASWDYSGSNTAYKDYNFEYSCAKLGCDFTGYNASHISLYGSPMGNPPHKAERVRYPSKAIYMFEMFRHASGRTYVFADGHAVSFPTGKWPAYHKHYYWTVAGPE